MPEPERAEPTKIAYLFGAGATHAELQNIEPDLIKEKTGLLIKNVSSRVIESARRHRDYLKDVEMVSGTKGSLNIELLRGHRGDEVGLPFAPRKFGPEADFLARAVGEKPSTREFLRP